MSENTDRVAGVSTLSGSVLMISGKGVSTDIEVRLARVRHHELTRVCALVNRLRESGMYPAEIVAAFFAFRRMTAKPRESHSLHDPPASEPELLGYVSLLTPLEAMASPTTDISELDRVRELEFAVYQGDVNMS